MILSPVRTGVVLGAFVGLAHVCWAALVAAGWAQWLVDFVLRLHFLQVPVTLAAFEFSTAGLLVAITAAFGFSFGFVFALLWNGLHSNEGVSASALR